jgi:hypothetical protein
MEEQEETIAFNYTEKENAIKKLETEKAFKDLNIPIL